MTKTAKTALDLKRLHLEHGSHKTREKGVCAMEAVAWLANEPHSDKPKCACPVITRYVQTINDRFTDEERQRLKDYLPRIVGSRDGKALDRAKLLAFRAGNVFAPLALEAAGLNEWAEKLRAVEFGDWDNQKKVAREARNADADAYAAADAADAAAYAADAADAAAADAVDAAAYAAYAAADAAYAAADAAAYAYAAADAAAYAAAYAAYAAADAYAYAKRKSLKSLRAKLVDAALQALDDALNIK